MATPYQPTNLCLDENALAALDQLALELQTTRSHAARLIISGHWRTHD